MCSTLADIRRTPLKMSEILRCSLPGLNNFSCASLHSVRLALINRHYGFIATGGDVFSIQIPTDSNVAPSISKLVCLHRSSEVMHLDARVTSSGHIQVATIDAFGRCVLTQLADSQSGDAKRRRPVEDVPLDTPRRSVSCTCSMRTEPGLLNRAGAVFIFTRLPRF